MVGFPEEDSDALVELVRRFFQRDDDTRGMTEDGMAAYEAMQAGSKGYSGVFANIHPELYAWLYHKGAGHPELARELSVFLVTSAVSELMGYPAFAKLFHKKRGTFKNISSRAIDYDILERFWWGGEGVLDKIIEGTNIYKEKIVSLC